MPIAQLANPSNLNVKTILCDLYEGINSVTPLALGGDEEAAANAISSMTALLGSVGLDSTTLGCSALALSPNEGATMLYPNASQPGGPLNLPPTANDAKSGNNVYNQVYFTQAPTTPQCS